MKMKKYLPEQAPEKHLCESYRKDDWIIYTCVKCDYELRENLVTGEMKVKNAKANVRHSGSYIPAEHIQKMNSNNFNDLTNIKDINKN